MEAWDWVREAAREEPEIRLQTDRREHSSEFLNYYLLSAVRAEAAEHPQTGPSTHRAAAAAVAEAHC